MKVKDYQKKLPFNQINSETIQQAIDKGVRYLKNHQYPNGEFCCYYSPDDAMEEWCVPDSTVFPTAIIATCLLSIEDHFDAKDIFRKSIPFFQYQMMRGGVMNYFTKWHPLFPLSPPDIDDTVFVHQFLQSQNIDCPDPSALILENRASNGLFYTWFTLRLNKSINRNYWLILLRELKNPIKGFLFWKHNDCRRNDIDAVVNANVLYYLGLNEITQPTLNYLLKIIENNQEADCDSWYRNTFTFYYFFSRTLAKGISVTKAIYQAIITRIIAQSKSDGSIGNSPLNTAFAITCLVNLNYKGKLLQDAVSYLVKSQKETGEWPRQIFFYSGPKQAVGWGSEELTTGFCIEALANYQKFIQS